MQSLRSTRLKERILGYYQDMQAHKQGQDTELISNADVGFALNKACEHYTDNDAIHLARVANAVRRDMFKQKKQFNVSLEKNVRTNQR